MLSAVLIKSRIPGAGSAESLFWELDVGYHRFTLASYEIFLEGQNTLCSSDHRWMIIVSHWTNIYADIATTTKFPSCFAQCAAVLQDAISDQMGSKITVSYSEPGFITKNCELVKHRGEIILYTPSEFSFDSGERVNYGIDIGADFQTVPCEIVADIAYDTY